MYRKVNHILLIDDNEIDNYISKNMIMRFEIAQKITVKNSGIEALQFLKNECTVAEDFPDIIFLDIRMPEMNGFEFLDEYAKLPSDLISQCDLYMLSSSSNDEDLKLASENPYVKRYFTKPFSELIFKLI